MVPTTQELRFPSIQRIGIRMPWRECASPPRYKVELSLLCSYHFESLYLVTMANRDKENKAWEEAAQELKYVVINDGKLFVFHGF
jgi:hypothetical protein